ncbi:MAG: redoxin domain-containing protein [Treponema sp.]|nr:redoxin domain-containing protein [Treponema sp.]
MLETGTKAPDFELPDQNGKIHKLSNYAGKKVILYFYPKDNIQDAQNRPAAFQKDIRSLCKKAL